MKKIVLLAVIPALFATSAIAGNHKKYKKEMMKKMQKASEQAFKLEDKNKDGKLNFDEFEDFNKRVKFLMIDANNDGFLTEKELKEAKKHMMRKKRHK